MFGGACVLGKREVGRAFGGFGRMLFGFVGFSRVIAKKWKGAV